MAAGLGSRWVPKEPRTSFVSMMSYYGVPVEEIARLAGDASSRTTDIIYRRELRPVITIGPRSWTRFSVRGEDEERLQVPLGDHPAETSAGTDVVDGEVLRYSSAEIRSRIGSSSFSGMYGWKPLSMARAALRRTRFRRSVRLG